MVRIFILIATCTMFANCSSNYQSAGTTDVMTIGVKQSVMTTGDSIQLEIRNLTGQPIRVNNPRSTSVVKIDAMDKNGKEATRLLLIHDLKAGKNDFIDVAPNDSALVNHVRPLGELFQLNKGEQYTLRLRYEGVVLQDNKKIMYNRIFSDTVFIQ